MILGKEVDHSRKSFLAHQWRGSSRAGSPPASNWEPPAVDKVTKPAHSVNLIPLLTVLV